MDKLKELNKDKDTLVFYTTDNGAWQDVYPDAGYTPFRGTKGTVREGGNRVPAFASWPGKIAPGSIRAGLRLVARQDRARFDQPRHRRRPRPDDDLRLRGRRQAADQ